MRKHEVEVWRFSDALVERYRCAPGPEEGVEAHAHEGYQFCLTDGVACSYGYRGARHLVPRGSLCVLHPGETHATRDAEPRAPGATYRMLYLDPAEVRAVAEEALGRHAGEPFFADPVVRDARVLRLFRALHVAVEGAAERPEREALLMDALSLLVGRHAQTPPSLAKFSAPRRELSRVRDYLQDHPDRPVALEELSGVAGLSVYHLSRAFRAEFGVPPYAYHLRVRVLHAKALLGLGVPPASASREAGFSDQSRFGRHFARVVGTTPGRYRKSKNRLYAGGGGGHTPR